MRQSDGSPLGQSRTGDAGSVAVGGKVGDILPFSSDILIKDVIHDPADGVVNRAAIYEALVVSGAVCDVKAIPAPCVPFRVDTI